jgi:hypothetical protein
MKFILCAALVCLGACAYSMHKEHSDEVGSTRPMTCDEKETDCIASYEEKKDAFCAVYHRSRGACSMQDYVRVCVEKREACEKK